MVAIHGLAALLFAALPHPEHLRLTLLQVAAYPVPTADLAGPASATGTNGLLVLIGSFVSQAKAGGFVAALIQALKKAKGPGLNWINMHTPGVTRAVAAAAAALTALGLHWTFTGSTLTITGLSLTAITAAAYAMGTSYMMQHAWWKLLFGSPATAAPPAGA